MMVQDIVKSWKRTDNYLIIIDSILNATYSYLKWNLQCRSIFNITEIGVIIVFWNHFDRVFTLWDIWGKHDFTSERFLNQADLERYELWCQEVNASVRNTRNSYEYCMFSFIVLLIYDHLNLYLFFLMNSW